jgi:hypothetical protein
MSETNSTVDFERHSGLVDVERACAKFDESKQAGKHEDGSPAQPEWFDSPVWQTGERCVHVHQRADAPIP